MSDWPAAREAMLASLEPTLGVELAQAFGEMLPRQPWREAISTQHWYRPAVLDAIAEVSYARYQLHESLIRVIGEEHAGTLMEYLVPARWRDLERLGVPLEVLAA